MGFPDFSAPPPVERRLPDTSAQLAIEPTHTLILRDDKTGVRIKAETIVGQTFGAVVRDLADGQVPLGFCLDSVRFDDGDRVVTDVTAKVLRSVLTLCNERTEAVSLPLVAAFERYGIDLPAFEEGFVETGLIQAPRRRGDDLLQRSAA